MLTILLCTAATSVLQGKGPAAVAVRDMVLRMRRENPGLLAGSAGGLHGRVGCMGAWVLRRMGCVRAWVHGRMGEYTCAWWRFRGAAQSLSFFCSVLHYFLLNLSNPHWLSADWNCSILGVTVKHVLR